MRNKTPDTYVHNDVVLTEYEALEIVYAELGDSCGDIRTDLDLIATLNELEKGVGQ